MASIPLGSAVGISLAAGVLERLAGAVERFAVVRFFMDLPKPPSIRADLSVRERYHVFFESFVQGMSMETVERRSDVQD